MRPITGSWMLGTGATASAQRKVQSSNIAPLTIVERQTAPTIVARQTAITTPGATAPGKHEDD